jgi:hypothetical protein
MDATDTSQFVNLGMTGRGMEVMVHRSVVESDLFIFMSTPQVFSRAVGNRSWLAWATGSPSSITPQALRFGAFRAGPEEQLVS